MSLTQADIDCARLARDCLSCPFKDRECPHYAAPPPDEAVVFYPHGGRGKPAPRLEPWGPGAGPIDDE